MATTTTKFDPAPPHEQTFAHQEKLPKLPIPPLEDTCKRYLRALEALQTPHEHEETRRAVQEFLDDPEQGPKIQKKLEEWAKTIARCDFVILSILYEVHLVDMLSSFSPATSKTFGESLSHFEHFCHRPGVSSVLPHVYFPPHSCFSSSPKIDPESRG